jgi:hypothetical protein
VRDISGLMDAGPGSPAHLPDVPTGDWGGLLLFDQLSRKSGGPRAFTLSVTGLDVADALDVTVRLSSRDEQARVLAPASAPAEGEIPAACKFGIGPETTDAEYSAALDGCVTAWVDLHGAPLEPDIEVSVNAPGAGGGLKEEGSLEASWLFLLHAERDTVLGCKDVEVSEELKADAAYLQFDKLGLAGAGGSTENVTLDAFAYFYDPDGGFVSSAYLSQAIAAGTRYWIVGQVKLSNDIVTGYSLGGTVNPSFAPTKDAFVADTVDALFAGGWGLACWRVSGDYPRDGFVEFTINGRARYAQPEEP